MPTPLGRWENPSHRVWGWLLDQEKNFLYERRDDIWKVYAKQGVKWVSEGLTRTQPEGIPASVRKDNAGRIKFRSSCEMVIAEVKQYESFWDLMREWGGDWMWEHMTDETKNQDFSWIETAMKEGTLVWCADGSYKRKVAPDVCGVGWVVECTKTGKRLEGLFYEVTEDANGYRAEQLGICAIHHLMTAISIFYQVKRWKTRAGCDNEGTIKISRRRLKRIRNGMSCADILRNIRNCRNRMTTDPNYYHVYGHMDDILMDEQLSFEQRLNKRCDLLAKEAVELCRKSRLQGSYDRGTQLLPCESAAVLVGGVKITGDIADAIRYAKGYEEAKKFLVEEKGWSLAQFEAVD